MRIDIFCFKLYYSRQLAEASSGSWGRGGNRLLAVTSSAKLWKRLTAIYLGNIAPSKREMSLPNRQLMSLQLMICLLLFPSFPLGKTYIPNCLICVIFFLIIFFYVLVRCGKFEIGPNFPSLKKKYTSSSAKYLPQLIPFPFLTPVISHQGEKLESRAHIISPQTSKGKHKQIYLSFSLKIKIK